MYVFVHYINVIYILCDKNRYHIFYFFRSFPSDEDDDMNVADFLTLSLFLTQTHKTCNIYPSMSVISLCLKSFLPKLHNYPLEQQITKIKMSLKAFQGHNSKLHTCLIDIFKYAYCDI